MKFLVNLIEIEAGQNPFIHKIMKDNCTHVRKHFWIYEGDLMFLKDQGVVFEIAGSGIVPGLGDMSRNDIVKLCENVFDIIF